jgi:uncharacterized protein YraI
MAKRKKTAPAAFAKYTVSCDWGQNLRSGPGPEYPVLRVIPRGSTVETTTVEGHWARVEEGWMDLRCMKEVRIHG